MTDIVLGTTDRTVLVFITDPAQSDGSGKTGLAHTDMTVSYTRVETDNDVVVTDVTSSLAAITNLTDAHSDWGWKEVSSTLAPGVYRLDIADAVFAAGAWEAVVYVTITTSLAAPSPMKFNLVSGDLSSLSSRIPAALTGDGNIKADTQKILGADPEDSADIATAVLTTADSVETGYTLQSALRVILAIAGGKVSGAGTTEITIRSITDSRDCIVATVDADGNRSAITVDLTD